MLETQRIPLMILPRMQQRMQAAKFLLVGYHRTFADVLRAWY